MIQPELIKSLRSYNTKTFFADLSSGIIVGVVALPLAIAFAIASGVSPERGLFTAIIAGFIISALGGSKVQIGGPTGAFAVIVYNIVQQFGLSGLATATLMAGILLILLGVFKLGRLISFIPYTIITGFTAGIAVTIFTTQVGDFFGLKTGAMPGDWFGKVLVYSKTFSTIDIYTTLVAIICLVIIFVWPHFNKKIPGSLVVIILSTVICLLLQKFAGLETVTIGSRYGQIPSTLPAPQLPAFSIQLVKQLAPASISIAVLAAIESLLSAAVADGMIESKHDSNMELIAQGAANILSPLFGGIPATGAIARTATNIKNGGRTPVAGIIHTLTLLLIMLFLGKYVVYIPMAALAAVLVSVSWNMAGIPTIKAVMKGQKADTAVLFVTFLLTVFIDLTVAIEAGLLLAAFFFIQKTVKISAIKKCDSSSEQTAVYELSGPLFFGTIGKFESEIEKALQNARVLVLNMACTNYLDAGGAKALAQLKTTCDKKNIALYIAGICEQPEKLLAKTGVINQIGKENIFASVEAAVAKCNKEEKESI